MKYVETSFKKLKEEDRRFLLNKDMITLSVNVQGSNHNTSLMTSTIAIIIAGYSVALQTKNILGILTYGIVATIGLIILTKTYKKRKRNLEKENKFLKVNYDKLLKMHLSYAKTKE